MMLLDRRTCSWEDGWIRELPERLRGDELLVVNNARVIPARLFGRRAGVGAEPAGQSRKSRIRREFLQSEIEVLLVRRLAPDRWEALVRPGRKVRTGELIFFGSGLQAEVLGRGTFGLRELRFTAEGKIEETLERIGHVPLPPYIHRADQPADRSAIRRSSPARALRRPRRRRDCISARSLSNGSPGGESNWRS